MSVCLQEPVPRASRTAGFPPGPRATCDRHRRGRPCTCVACTCRRFCTGRAPAGCARAWPDARAPTVHDDPATGEGTRPAAAAIGELQPPRCWLGTQPAALVSWRPRELGSRGLSRAGNRPRRFEKDNLLVRSVAPPGEPSAEPKSEPFLARIAPKRFERGGDARGRDRAFGLELGREDGDAELLEQPPDLHRVVGPPGCREGLWRASRRLSRGTIGKSLPSSFRGSAMARPRRVSAARR